MVSPVSRLWLSLSFLCAVQGADVCSVSRLNRRVDCAPDPDVTQESCVQRGCCWQPASADNRTAVAAGVPWCYFPTNYGYKLLSTTATSSGYTFALQRNSQTPAYIFGGDIPALTVSLVFETDARVRVKITDSAKARYEVPLETPPPPTAKPSNPLYNVSWSNNPFSLKVTRASTQTVVFDSSLGGLVYSDQFLQFTTTLASTSLYGLGEHISPLMLDVDWQNLVLFARDQGTPTGYTNLYGVHPFYLNVEPDGLANGLFFLNSNAMEVALQPAPAATFRTIGGILDFYIMLGPSPGEVTGQYATVVGLPSMPPYWSLGFHLCRWGYGSLDQTRKINDGMRNAGVPQDTQWHDIDYMYDHLDFTYDPELFEGLPDFVTHLHQDYHQRYVMIIDPGIANTKGAGNYPAYDEALAQGLFVNASNGQPWMGTVWPGPTNFPDFFNPATTAYWTKYLQEYHQSVPFDGVWIDMNEVATTGPSDACPSNKFTNPPYVPGVADGDLNQKTFCMDAKHYGGEVNYNLHSLYGYVEQKATFAAALAITKERPLVISRSTFSGSGKYGGHWLGDNTATWNDLELSIAGILTMNMLAVPLVGADICGFNGNTNLELCSRWMQLGAFYPFSRNHNTIGDPDQDPVSMGADVVRRSIAALNTRYELLPFLYTLFYQAATTGTTVARPLFFEFPTDTNTLDIDKQFMWGANLLFSPVTTQGATTVEAYFPPARWFDFYNYTEVPGTAVGGGAVTLPADLDTKMPLHQRGGSALMCQSLGTAFNTKEAAGNNFTLRVALDESFSATGEWFQDDGVSPLPASGSGSGSGSATVTTFTVTGSKSQGQLKASPAPSAAGVLDGVTMVGLGSEPKTVLLNGKTKVNFSFSFASAGNGVLKVEQLAQSLSTAFTLQWSF